MRYTRLWVSLAVAALIAAALFIDKDWTLEDIYAIAIAFGAVLAEAVIHTRVNREQVRDATIPPV